MINIVGYDKFNSKKNGKVYYQVYFTWPDDIDFGSKAASCICSDGMYQKVSENPESTRVGYNREENRYYLYLK